MSRFSRLEFDRPSRTSELASQASGTEPRTAEQFLDLAEEAYRRGNFEESMLLHTRCLREDRTRIPAWVGQVQMLIELNELQEAQLWATKALELFKSNGDLLALKAQAAFRLADNAGALAASDAALRAAGTSPLRWSVRGEITLRTDSTSARRCFDRALSEPGSGWFDRLRISRIYLHHDQPAAAITWAQAASHEMPDAPFAWLTRALCEDALGMDDEAARSYARVLELAPRHPHASQRLAHLADTTSVRSRLRRFRGWFKK